MRGASLLGLWVAGVLLEAGCLGIWAMSPKLTAGYNAEFTTEFFARLPWLSGLAYRGEGLQDLGSMVGWLEAGLLLMTVGYLAGLLVLDSSRLAERAAAQVVVGLAVVFRLTFVVLPGLFSTDIFSYVMYGRIAAVHGQNPYVRPPSDFPDDPFLGWVFAFWRDQPSVYGPVWTDFSWLLSTLTGGLSAFDQVVAYRLSLNLFELLSLGVLWWLLGLLQTQQRTVAFAMFAWNPLVLFDLAGNAHNDVAMLLLLLLGLVPIARTGTGNWLLGIGLMTVGALVKYMTGVAALLWTTAWVAQGRSWRERLTRLGGSVGLGLGLAAVLWWPWLQQPQALVPLGAAAGGKLVINSAPDLIALTVADQILQPAGMDAETAQATARLFGRALARIAFVVYLGWELRRVWQAASVGGRPLQIATIRASTRALLVLPLLVFTWVWSWYFSCSLALAALLGWKSGLSRVVVAYTLIGLPIVYAHQYLNQDMPASYVLVFAFGPLLVTRVASARRRNRSLSRPASGTPAGRSSDP